jgi:hypothetical protein
MQTRSFSVDAAEGNEIFQTKTSAAIGELGRRI